MGYVIAAILVLLIVAAGVTLYVLNAARRQRQSAIADSDEHAGRQTTEGRTVAHGEGESGGH